MNSKSFCRNSSIAKSFTRYINIKIYIYIYNGYNIFILCKEVISQLNFPKLDFLWVAYDTIKNDLYLGCWYTCVA